MFVVCGEALVDLTPAQCGTAQGFIPHPGGSPCNVAVALARLGAPVAFLGRVSTDAFGRMLKRHLEENGVDLRYLQRGPEPTPLAFVQMAEGGEPEFAFYREDTADRLLASEDVPARLPPEVSTLHFGSLSLVLEPLATTLRTLFHREHGGRLISLDPNVRPRMITDPDAYRRMLEALIARADVVKASRADLCWLYPGVPVLQAASRWREMGPAIVVVTLAEDGAVGFGGAGTMRVPGKPAKVVDTVGAGDAFTAGLLGWLYHQDRLTRAGLRGLSREEFTRALDYANQVAALTCERAGADPPRREEVERPTQGASG